MNITRIVDYFFPSKLNSKRKERKFHYFEESNKSFLSFYPKTQFCVKQLIMSNLSQNNILIF